MAPRRVRKPRNRSHPLADKIFPTILRNVAPTERPYPFLKRNLKAYAPDRRSLNRRKEWELDLFCSKREVEEAESPDATDSQDSQADSLAYWKMQQEEGLIVVTESGSLRSCAGSAELRSGKVPGWTMLVDFDLKWKPTYRRHIQPLEPKIQPARTSVGKVTFRLEGEDKGTQVMDGWRCPLCVPLDYGSWLRLHHHIEREHPDVKAELGHYLTVDIRERRPEVELEPVSMSSRLELGTLADRLPELMEGYNGGDFEHLIREREEIIFGWIHFTGKRRFLLCMWNRWVAEKGPLLIHSGRKYICDWIERDRHRLIKYDLGVELRDHLMIMVEYKHIDSMTALMALRKLKDPPVN
ncbi:hypothetical protein FFLO_00891 [Filobasidium floriforme]|uniref:Uncharacterized protein n=1 Tax=Filobasidium floriforme TaxID=5210 RepID=A0A8K0JVN0_9TREE|nr:hypothetical protein FFLO_00891 [Filobasidium floriforme]